MSVHPSLSGKSANKQERTVLTRLERLKKLREDGKWQEGDSVFGLPKVKTIRLKLKKEKAEKPDESAEGAEGAVAAETAAGEKSAAPAEKEKEAKK